MAIKEKTPTIKVGWQIRYTALGGPTLGIVKDMMDDVLLVHVAPESWLLVRRDQVAAIFPKFE